SPPVPPLPRSNSNSNSNPAFRRISTIISPAKEMPVSPIAPRKSISTSSRRISYSRSKPTRNPPAVSSKTNGLSAPSPNIGHTHSTLSHWMSEVTISRQSRSHALPPSPSQ